MGGSPGSALPVFTERRIQRGTGSLYVRDFPGGAPPFVLLHGFPDNAHIYDDLIPHLASAGHFADMTYGLTDELAANTARLLEFRRSDVPLLLSWGKLDPYLHVGVPNICGPRPGMPPFMHWRQDTGRRSTRLPRSRAS